MADKTIGELPSLSTMEDDTLIPVEHDGEAKSMAGTVLQGYVYDLVQDDVETISEIIAVGPKGEDGVSPSLSSSKTGKTTTVYYTDATHTTPTVLATLQDGADGSGVGDMLKTTYDADDDGIVDDSEKLGGQLPSYYQPKVTVNGVVQGDGSGNLSARSVSTAPESSSSSSSNLVTAGALYNSVKRTDSIDASNTAYSTKMARAIYATTTDLTPGTSSLTSGVICVVYEA